MFRHIPTYVRGPSVDRAPAFLARLPSDKFGTRLLGQDFRKLVPYATRRLMLFRRDVTAILLEASVHQRLQHGLFLGILLPSGFKELRTQGPTKTGSGLLLRK